VKRLFKSPIFWRMLLWSLLLAVVPLAIVGIFIQSEIKTSMDSLQIKDLKATTHIIAVAVASEPDHDHLQESVSNFSSEEHTIFVLDGNGYYLAHTDPDKIGHSASEDFDADTIQKILAGNDGVYEPAIDVEPQKSILEQVIGYERIDSGDWIVGVGRISIQLIVALLITSLIGGIGVSTIIGPLIQLSGFADRLRSGELEERIETEDMEGEFTILANSLNSFAEQVLQSIRTLEQRVAERTRDLQIASHVVREITRVLDLQDLLPRLVNLTNESYRLYFTSVYIYDESNRRLVFESGTGNVGHRTISIDEVPSPVAQAGRERQPVVINDVSSMETYVTDPHLPETRSEAAFPMLIQDKLIGVLNAQSRTAGYFTDEFRQVLGTLAEQIAIAIQNARLFEEQLALTAQLRTEDQMKAEIMRSMSQDLRIKDRALASSVSAVMINALDGTALYVNDAFCKMFGYPLEEALKLKAIDTADDHDLAVRVINEVQTIGFYSGEGAARRMDGSTFTAQFSANLISDMEGQPIATLGTFIDISARKKAEEELHIKDRALASSVNAVIINGLDGKTLYVNDAFCRLFGYSHEEAMRLSVFDLSDPESTEAALNALKARGSYEAEATGIRKDGSRIPVQIQAATVTSLEGKPIALTASFVDITETRLSREKLEQHVTERTRDLQIASHVASEITRVLDLQELLPRLVERTKEGFGLYFASVYLYDMATGQLALEAGTGMPGQEMKRAGKVFSIDSTSNLVARAGRERRAVVVGDISKSGDYIANPLLPEICSEASIPMLVQDELVGVMSVQSTSPDYFSEANLQVLTMLSEQIGIAITNARLFEEQKKVAEELRRVDEMKSQFLASMSHELRTPMNAIINFVEVVVSGLVGPVNGEQKELLGQSLQSSQHLLHLINDVLDISKIQAGRLTLFIENDVNLYAQLKPVMEIANSLLKEKGKALQLVNDIDDNLPVICGDKRRIRQILLNLLSNAIKFTEKGTITLSVKNCGNKVIFAVIDTGPGIPEAAQEMIFEPFQQTMDGIKQVEGTGLGLPIARSLVEAHGGRMWLESQPGEGAAFYFDLPIS
jgi:PAS domain S-box-containing protein